MSAEGYGIRPVVPDPAPRDTIVSRASSQLKLSSCPSLSDLDLVEV